MRHWKVCYSSFGFLVTYDGLDYGVEATTSAQIADRKRCDAASDLVIFILAPVIDDGNE